MAETMPFDADDPDRAFDGSANADRSPIFTRKRLVVGALAVIASTSAFIWSRDTKAQDRLISERNSQKLTAIAEGLKAKTYKWASESGVTQVASIEIPEGTVFGIAPIVRLSRHPNDKTDTCTPAVFFMDTPQGKYLVDPSTDAAGVVWPNKITNGEQAKNFLDSKC